MAAAIFAVIDVVMVVPPVSPECKDLLQERIHCCRTVLNHRINQRWRTNLTRLAAKKSGSWAHQ
jgi:hypothetical protein